MIYTYSQLIEMVQRKLAEEGDKTVVMNYWSEDTVKEIIHELGEDDELEGADLDEVDYLLKNPVSVLERVKDLMYNGSPLPTRQGFKEIIQGMVEGYS